MNNSGTLNDLMLNFTVEQLSRRRETNRKLPNSQDGQKKGVKMQENFQKLSYHENLWNGRMLVDLMMLPLLLHIQRKFIEITGEQKCWFFKGHKGLKVKVTK